MRVGHLATFNLPTTGNMPDFQETIGVQHLRALFQASTGEPHYPWIIASIDPTGERTLDPAGLARRLENLRKRFPELFEKSERDWLTKYSEN